jgi:hypothetical protein
MHIQAVAGPVDVQIAMRFDGGVDVDDTGKISGLCGTQLHGGRVTDLRGNSKNESRNSNAGSEVRRRAGFDR